MTTPVYFEVLGLFGEFDHRVPFPADREFVIIHGPNGVGKTRFFEGIAALSKLDVGRLLSLPCSSISITYSGGEVLSFGRAAPEPPFINFRSAVGHDIVWQLDPADLEGRAAFLGGSTWRPVGGDMWMDEEDGETISREALERRHDVVLGGPPAPPALQEFSDALMVRSIETTRLSRPTPTPTPTQRARRGTTPTQSTISRYAIDLRRLLGEELAANSRVSQALDRTFPRRLLNPTEAESHVIITDEQIRARYAEQNDKRARLAALALTPVEPDIPLLTRPLQDWERQVLWRHLDDTAQKLATFDALLARVTLLQELTNRRFLRKHIEVNVEDGLRIVADNGIRIQPRDLSSGEQHQLIMLYDLLFAVTPGALVLVDEPEISLHVAWQREFLPDMIRVLQVTGARCLVATHSPQIIGKWRNRTVQLGPEGPDEQRGMASNHGTSA